MTAAAGLEYRKSLAVDSCFPPWEIADFQKTRIPRYGIALLEALRFSGDRSEKLQQLDDAEWRLLLALTDPAQLTLLVGHVCRGSLPGWVRDRIERNYLDNARRFARLESSLFEISESLSRKSIDFALLKGTAHAAHFTPDPLLRAQGDIDLWCLPEKVFAARDTLLQLGYRPLGHSAGRHLDPMVREESWQWTGDYFALDLPIPVDLHYKLWDEQLERIAGPNENELWRRRCFSSFDGHPLPSLDLADALAFSALHLLMHLLHGDVRLERSWEIAYFLHHSASDRHFWARWRELYSAEQRHLQAIVFALSAHWFGCRMPEVLYEEVDSFSSDVALWMKHYSSSPLESLFLPNKHELWLNLCLLKSFRDKQRVFARRLLPVPARKAPAGSAEKSQPGQKHPPNYLAYLGERASHHASLLPATCVGGFQWWWMRQGLGRDLSIYLVASALFDFGESIFFLLYNLYLLERGFTEAFIGQVASAATVGTFIGVLPAAACIRRFGLRSAVLLSIVGIAAANVLRAFAVSQVGLLGSALMNGLFMSFWAVSLLPAVASLTTERSRTLVFSLCASLGIGVGALAGVVGGPLPGALIHLSPSLTALGSKRLALLLSSALAALATVPAVLISFPTQDPTDAPTKSYPRSRFMYAFLAALFIWTLGTAAFNPLFNVFFSRHLHLGAQQIGFIYSYSQMSQVVVIPLAPLVLKKLGAIRGIASMQLATAAALGLIALASNSLAGAIFYIAYMSFQYMSEPCLFSVLMTRVDSTERSGASALNFLTTSLAGIFAAAAGGFLFSRLGYGPTLAGCGTMLVLAAFVFFISLRERR